MPAMAQQSASPAQPATPAEQPAASAAQKSETPITEIKVECLPASRAAELLGKHGCIAGRVSRVSTPKNGSTHLSLCPRRSNCEFHLVTFAHDRDAVGDLSYLHGKVVAVVGDVTKYRGEPEIIITNRKQLQVIAGDPPSQFDAAQSKATSAGQNKRGRTW